METTDSTSSSQPVTSTIAPHVLWRQVVGLIIWGGLWLALMVSYQFPEARSLGVAGIAVVLSAAVFVDAWRAGIGRVEGRKAFLNMSPMEWGFAVAVFFPVFCLVYLINRGKLRTRESNPVFFIIAACLWGAAVLGWLVYLILKLTGTA